MLRPSCEAHNLKSGFSALFLSDRIIVLSNKPSQVAGAGNFHVPFSRPREESLFLEDEFLEWKRKIYYTPKKTGE
jgi:ABC-type nitrate/sulfonate/bicarbonate transport system ATPase subunit